MAANGFSTAPALSVASRDGTRIAVYAVGDASAPEPVASTGASDRPPLLLVHGATADHTTWRTVGPRLARSRPVFALDRRGRGRSGDSSAYAIEREYEDVAAVADAIAQAAGRPDVDIVGHSYGGRCALGASLLTAAIRRLVVYEGAPVPPGSSYRPDGLLDAVSAALDRGDPDAALSSFLAGVVGMSPEDLARYRADPVWPERVAAAHTIVREVRAEAGAAASLEALAAVAVPVLLILGTASRSPFRIGTEALADRLLHARVVEIEGAAHAAHHTHAAQFVRLVEDFLDAAHP